MEGMGRMGEFKQQVMRGERSEVTQTREAFVIGREERSGE